MKSLQDLQDMLLLVAIQTHLAFSSSQLDHVIQKHSCTPFEQLRLLMLHLLWKRLIGHNRGQTFWLRGRLSAVVHSWLGCLSSTVEMLVGLEVWLLLLRLLPGCVLMHASLCRRCCNLWSKAVQMLVSMQVAFSLDTLASLYLRVRLSTAGRRCRFPLQLCGALLVQLHLYRLLFVVILKPVDFAGFSSSTPKRLLECSLPRRAAGSQRCQQKKQQSAQTGGFSCHGPVVRYRIRKGCI
mmetsp:Transcript_46249/g.107537  ORF Transcript_46249/g.107537 Transcript_46249/m.107537 type:complete len:239 (-) Transcript_46249:27-743(-)